MVHDWLVTVSGYIISLPVVRQKIRAEEPVEHSCLPHGCGKQEEGV